MLIEQQYNAKDLPQDGWSNARFGLPEVSFNPLFWKKTKLIQKEACVYKKPKNFRLLAIAAFFWKSTMKKLALRLKIPICNFFAPKLFFKYA